MSLIIFVIAVFYFDQSNFVCTNVRTELFYMYENQCTQILNLPNPEHGIYELPNNLRLRILEN